MQHVIGMAVVEHVQQFFLICLGVLLFLGNLGSFFGLLGALHVHFRLLLSLIGVCILPILIIISLHDVLYLVPLYVAVLELQRLSLLI